MLAFLAALWGASFLFIAIAVGELGAVGLAEGRVVLAATGLAAYAAALGRLPALRARWRGYVVLGAVNAALPFVLVAAAELTIPASLAAIVNATAPLFSAAGAAIWLAQPLPRRGAAGLALGLAGTALAYLVYFRLIAELGATSALTVTYLVPVFGVPWAALFRGEQVTGGMLAGAGVVLAGVLMVTGTGPRRRSPPPPGAGPPAEGRGRRPGPPPRARTAAR